MSEPHPRSTAASPFQRRLGLLAVVMLSVVSVLGLRHAWLSVVNGEHHRRAAMAALSELTVLPTIRGTIRDARGEALAEDRAPGLAVELAFALVEEEAWVREEARRKARGAIGGDAWRRLTPQERDRALDAAMPEAAARRSSLLRHVARESGIPIEELQTRLRGIRSRVATLSRFVRERQRLAWAAEALGTGLADLEALAAESPTPGGPWFDAAAAGVLGIPAAAGATQPSPTAGPAPLRSLEDLLLAAGVDPAGFTPRPIREEVGFHDVASPVNRDAANAIAVAASTFGMGELVRLRDARLRVRPWTDGEVEVEIDGSMLPGSRRFDDRRTVGVRGVGASIIGTMSSVQAEDVAERPFDAEEDRGGYRPLDDRVGRTGLEGVLEDRLRGERGLRRDRVRLLAETVGDDGAGADGPDLVPRVDGSPVRTTLDIRLQARIRAALHPSVGLTLADPAIHGTSGRAGVEAAFGHPLAVGVAVLDVRSGDVLALVNGPSREELPDPAMEPIIEESGWLELDIAGRWGTTPGSTIKPLILAAAVSDGLLTATQTIECTGH
ncbi:MAG: penicillin-binding transpeptidase domain-containing protein, partial [Planctomycetota bacterium]